MENILAVDVDDTLYPTTPLFTEACEVLGLETFGVKASWSYIWDRYGPEDTPRIFEYALCPSRLDQRELYPDVVDSIRYVQEEAGYQVVFLTHNHNPLRMQIPLERWLREHFGGRVQAIVTRSDTPKRSVMERIDAVGLVDDRPDTLEDVLEGGFFASTLIQPWNRELVESEPRIAAFSDWTEFPAMFLNWDMAAKPFMEWERKLRSSW